MPIESCRTVYPYIYIYTLSVCIALSVGFFSSSSWLFSLSILEVVLFFSFSIPSAISFRTRSAASQIGSHTPARPRTSSPSLRSISSSFFLVFSNYTSSSTTLEYTTWNIFENTLACRHYYCLFFGLFFWRVRLSRQVGNWTVQSTVEKSQNSSPFSRLQGDVEKNDNGKKRRLLNA